MEVENAWEFSKNPPKPCQPLNENILKYFSTAELPKGHVVTPQCFSQSASSYKSAVTRSSSFFSFPIEKQHANLTSI